MLGRGYLLRVAVDGPAGGGEHEAPRSADARGLEDRQRADHIRHRVAQRIGHRPADVDLGGKVKDDLWPE